MSDPGAERDGTEAERQRQALVAVETLSQALSASVQTAMSTALNGFMANLDSKLSRLEPPQSSASHTPVPSTGETVPGATASGATASGMSSINNPITPTTMLQTPGVIPAPLAIASVPLLGHTQTTTTTWPSHSPILSIGTGASNPTAGVIAPIVIGPNATLVSKKLVQKITRLEFVDMAELLSDNQNTGESSDDKEGKSDKKRKQKITNILQWVECFNSYIAIVATQHPTRVPDLLGYSSLIVHAARKFEGDQWLQYDRNFRKRMVGQPTRQWSDVDLSTWAMAFAKATPREHCNLCFSLDHTTKQCDDFQEPVSSKHASDTTTKQSTPPICLKWNWKECLSANCSYRHVCIECHREHKAKSCPQRQEYARHSRYEPYPTDRAPHSRPQYKGNAFRGKRYN